MKAVTHYIIIVLGVVAPTVELAWRLCSNIFFDPLPTLLHVLIAYGIPVGLIVAKLVMSGDFTQSRNRVAMICIGFALVFSLAYSIWFAPISPLCGIGILWFGVGGLGLVPFLLLAVSLSVIKDWTSWMPEELRSRSRKRMWWSFAMIVPALMILWWQPLITTLAGSMLSSEKPSTKYVGLKLLDYCVSDVHLRRQGLDWNSIFNGPKSDPVAMREAYYYIYGSRPGSPHRVDGLLGSPFWEFDEDQGTTNIGRRLRDLSLSESALDVVGRFSEDYAYTEWTMTFANTSVASVEARAVVELPPNSVVSKASLWIDGEEREAAFGTNSQVKTVYRQIVQARRDPFLVTVIGPDQIQVQCFPVPQHGTMKIRLGITSPLTDGKTIMLPHIVESNFNVSSGLRHSALVEADTPFRPSLPGRQAAVTRCQIQLTDSELSDRSAQFTFEGNPPVEYRLCGGSLVYRALMSQVAKDRKVILLIDGQDDILKSLKRISIPKDDIAGVVVSHPYDVSVWDGSSDLKKFIADQPAFGGTNSGLALIQALDLAERLDAPVVWLHGGLPPEYREQLRLEQVFRRASRSITIVSLSFSNQMNTIISDPIFFRFFVPARRSGNLSTDLSGAVDMARSASGSTTGVFLGGRWNSGIQITQTGETPISHPYRLFVYSQVMQEYLRDGTVDKDLLAEAIRTRIVTPVTGAVVLENQSQYQSATLDPSVGAENIPKIPEPGFYLLLGIAAIALAAMAYLRKEALC